MSSMPVDWDGEVVRDYLTAESHQKSKEQFLDTHIRIDKIRDGLTEDFVSEDDLLERIQWSDVYDDNRIFILRGTTGSGKSHLCQWLEYQIGQTPDEGAEDHVALHVSRGDTALGDILKIITEPLDESVQLGSAENLSSPDSYADTIVDTLLYRAEMGKIGFEDDIREITREDSDARDTLQQSIADNFREYQDVLGRDDDEEQPDLLNEDNYRAVAILAFGQARGGDTLFPALKEEIHSILSDDLGVGDFRKQLREYGKKYANKGLRPVLICEDITTFNVLKEQLLDHIFQLETGENESGYDVVLGYTTGWEEDKASRALNTGEENTLTYMKERSEMYLSTTDSQGRAYFLNEQVTVKMARKYLSVIREKSEIEPETEISEDAFDGLYPFNPSFVERAYVNLVQEGNERRTPRLLLVRVIRQCLLATSPPHDAVVDNPYVKDFPTEVSLTYSDEIQQLTKWFGRTTAQRNIAVHRGIIETFDIDVPDGTTLQDDQVIFSVNDPPDPPELDVTLVGGSTEPGEEITVQARLDNRPESEVKFYNDGDIVSETDDSGEASITLPHEEGSVTYQAQKEDFTDTITVDVGTDTLVLNITPDAPEPSETIEITAKLNGEPQSDVSITEDGTPVGNTNEAGRETITAPESGAISIRGEYENLADTQTIQVESEQRDWPTETDLSDDEVQQRLVEYQQWVSSGKEYNSSSTLQEGAGIVLEKWHDATRLGNSNATQTGTEGIYYARGPSVPVSLHGVAEKKGRSFKLQFGPENDTLYEPMFWAGISENGKLPAEDNGVLAIDYDKLRAWADDQVFEFRAQMREDIEDCLPEEMTIEELLVFTQFLLLNGGKGVEEVSRDLVFEEYGSPSGYDSPLGKRFDSSDGFREAFNDLTKSSQTPRGLAEGFFMLKRNFVDHERLEQAWTSVEENLDRYIQTAMQISPGKLEDGYRIGTTRSTATRQLNEFLGRVKTYATELNNLSASEHAEHIVSAVEGIEDWHDPSRNATKLRELFETVYDAVDTMDAGEMGTQSEWKAAKGDLDSQSKLSIRQFNEDFERFENVESASDTELVTLLHEFERSRSERVEWDIYEALGEMIEAAEETELPGDKDYRGQVASLDATSKTQKLLADIEEMAEGDS